MPISRRAFVTSAVASGIALSSSALLSPTSPGSLCARLCRGEAPGTRLSAAPAASTASPRLPGRSSTRRIFAPRICPDGRQRLRTPCCSGPRTRRMSMPALTCRGSAEAPRPDVIVTADDLARIGARVPDFYAGDLLCPVGRTPLYLGQPIALLIFGDFDAFDQARAALRDAAFANFGEEPSSRDAKLWRVSFHARSWPDPRGADVYSPVKNGWVSPGKFRHTDHNTEQPIWAPPPIPTGQAYAEAADIGEQIRKELAADKPALLVLEREFDTQSVRRQPIVLGQAQGGLRDGRRLRAARVAAALRGRARQRDMERRARTSWREARTCRSTRSRSRCCRPSIAGDRPKGIAEVGHDPRRPCAAERDL